MITVGQEGWLRTVMLIRSVAIALLVLNAIVINPIVWAETTCPSGMALIPSGTFQMGSDDSRYVEERSVADVRADRFCVDRTDVTNAQFEAFVNATGYQTIAERPRSKVRRCVCLRTVGRKVTTHRGAVGICGAGVRSTGYGNHPWGFA